MCKKNSLGSQGWGQFLWVARILLPVHVLHWDMQFYEFNFMYNDKRSNFTTYCACRFVWLRGLKSTEIEPYQWFSKTSNNKYRHTSYESLSELVRVLIWLRTETSCIMSLMSRWRLKMSSSLLSGKIQYNTCVTKSCSKNVVKI